MTGNIGIFQELVQGGPNGTIDADLIKIDTAYFQVTADNELQFIGTSIVTDDDLILTSPVSSTKAPSQRAARQALDDLDANGRFVPGTPGAAGTVFLGDKTFGAVPASPPTITQLSFDDYAFNPSDTTDASNNHQSRVIGSGYNINNYDLIRVYIGEPSIINNFSQMRTRYLWTPDDIPTERVIPDDASWARGRKRYMVGNQVQHMAFDDGSADRPIHMTFSVAKTAAGLIRVNCLHQTHWNNTEENWFGYNNIIEQRVGIAGISF